MEENWKPIKDYDKYFISDLGRVKSLKRKKEGKYLKPGNRGRGYLCVKLFKNGKSKDISIHRLVAMHFIPNINNKRCVDHINRIRNDNRLVNLRWATYSENKLNTTYPVGCVYKRKDRPSYCCVYYPERQKIKTKCFKTKEEAENFRQEMYEKYS